MSASINRTLHRRAVRETAKRARLDALRIGLNRHHSASESDSQDEQLHFVENIPGDIENHVDNIVDVDNSNHSSSDSEAAGAVEQVELAEIVERESDSEAESNPGVASEDELCSDRDDVAPRFENDAAKEQHVIDSVREWAQEPGLLSKSKLNDLLHRLSVVFPNMPLTYSTLFHCDYQFDIAELPSGGTMWYKGIRASLNQLYLKVYLEKFQKIVLDIGIDGLPVVKVKLWPILGHLVETDNAPFTIAVFKGASDPTNADEFMEKYVAELQDLFENGYEHEGKVYQFSLRNYILDAPARALVKCCVRHNGYAGCEKCSVYGESINNRMVFLDSDAPRRTDESFQQREQPRHHKGNSPLEAVGTGMVSQFRLDPMHLVYAGVFKRLLEYWLFVLGPWKLHFEVVDLISAVFEYLKPFCPGDFNRKPKSLKFFKTYKCTELRRILLYDGILAFKNLVDDNIFKHFLLLHCGIYILSSKRHFAEKRLLALEFLRLFVSHAANIYGLEFVVYNVHSLVHLVEECDTGLMLDDFSAFKFEDKLKSLKQTLRSGLHHLQQLARRDEEKTCPLVKLKSRATHIYLSLKHRVLNEVINGQQYKKLVAGSLTLKVGKTDSCFKTLTGDVVVLQNVVKRQRKVFLIGRKFNVLQDFYDYPIPSSDLGIVKVSELLRQRLVFRPKDIESKCFLMPDGGHFLCVPILHSMESM